MKICPMVAELFHADGQTDMTMLTVAFRNFLNAPKTKLAVWENKLFRRSHIQHTKAQFRHSVQLCKLNLVVHVITNGS